MLRNEYNGEFQLGKQTQHNSETNARTIIYNFFQIIINLYNDIELIT